MLDNSDKIWKLMHDMRFCMLTSWDGETLNARPMTSRVFKEDHAVYFLDNAKSEKECEIAEYPQVSLTYSDTAANTYLSISGAATVTDDRALIKKIWSEFDKAFFDSAEDPAIRVIKVTPRQAEIWEGPNKLATIVKLLTAAATGYKPSMGENEKVSI